MSTSAHIRAARHAKRPDSWEVDADREAAERVRPVPRWMQRVLADQEPSGSRELPNWLLYTLLAIAAAVVLFVAPGVA